MNNLPRKLSRAKAHYHACAIVRDWPRWLKRPELNSRDSIPNSALVTPWCPFGDIGYTLGNLDPWQECNRMEERLRFVARFLDGEKITPLCRAFGISRKTASWIFFNRYEERWQQGYQDRISWDFLREAFPITHRQSIDNEAELLLVNCVPSKWKTKGVLAIAVMRT